MYLYSHIYGHIIHEGQDTEIIFLLLFSLYVTSNSVTPWTAVHQVSLFTVSQNSLKLTSSESVMPSVSSSVTPLSSCPHSFPVSGSFPISHFFALGGQNIGPSASTSVLPMNIQVWFPLGLTGLSSMQSKGLSRVFSNTTIWKQLRCP